MAAGERVTLLQAALDKLLENPWQDARSIAIEALEGGIAMSTVVCTRCAPGRPMRFVGAIRHLMEVESARAEAHPELAHSPLHRPGDIRPGHQGELTPDEPWTSSPCKYCRAPIVFAITTRGNRIPVDRDASPNGTVLLVSMDSNGMGQPYAKFLHTEVERAGVDASRLHTMHANTCTNPKPKRSDQT